MTITWGLSTRLLTGNIASTALFGRHEVEMEKGELPPKIRSSTKYRGTLRRKYRDAAMRYEGNFHVVVALE